VRLCWRLQFYPEHFSLERAGLLEINECTVYRNSWHCSKMSQSNWWIAVHLRSRMSFKCLSSWYLIFWQFHKNKFFLVGWYLLILSHTNLIIECRMSAVSMKSALSFSAQMLAGDLPGFRDLIFLISSVQDCVCVLMFLPRFERDSILSGFAKNAQCIVVSTAPHPLWAGLYCLSSLSFLKVFLEMVRLIPYN
jgi:hypothetical protein